MSSISPDPEPPRPLAAYYRRIEPTREIAALKAQAAKSLSLRARSVFLQRDLAVCLHAVGRDAEAISIVEWPMAAVVYRGKGDAWYAASAAWAVAARVRRRRGEVSRVRDGLERFIEQPSHAMLLQPALWDTARLQSVNEEERHRFEEASGEDDTDTMAWAVGELVFLRETALPPFPHARLRLGWLDTSIAELLGRLRSRLER